MANLGWVSQVKGKLVGPACPTAGGDNELDYTLVHSAIEGVVQATFSAEVPFRPHGVVTVRIPIQDWLINSNCSQLSQNWVCHHLKIIAHLAKSQWSISYRRTLIPWSWGKFTGVAKRRQGLRLSDGAGMLLLAFLLLLHPCHQVGSGEAKK